MTLLGMVTLLVVVLFEDLQLFEKAEVFFSKQSLKNQRPKILYIWRFLLFNE